MLEPWMNKNIQIVSQLSNIGVWNKHEKNVTNVEWKRGPEKCFELC